jgi:hypothetical protein
LYSIILVSLCLAAAVMVKVTANRRQGVPPSDDGFLANVNMGDPEWRGLQEMAKQSNDYRSLIPGNLDLGGVVARYLVYRGLAETGWPRGSEPARPESRFTEWRRNLLLPQAPVPAPPGYRLTELGWKILERGQYARRQ